MAIDDDDPQPLKCPMCGKHPKPKNIKGVLEWTCKEHGFVKSDPLPDWGNDRKWPRSED